FVPSGAAGEQERTQEESSAGERFPARAASAVLPTPFRRAVLLHEGFIDRRTTVSARAVARDFSQRAGRKPGATLCAVFRPPEPFRLVALQVGGGAVALREHLAALGLIPVDRLAPDVGIELLDPLFQPGDLGFQP